MRKLSPNSRRMPASLLAAFQPAFLSPSLNHKNLYMATAALCVVDGPQVEDRSVKAFGPDGELRRKRFSQDSARRLAELRTVVAVWDRRRSRIVSIHFYGESRIPLKSRLRAGTRYSYLEQVSDRRTWRHKGLPYQAMDAATGRVESPEIIDRAIRLLFQQVPTSIMSSDVPNVTVPKPIMRPTNVVSIEAGRTKLSKKAAAPRHAEVVEFRRAA